MQKSTGPSSGAGLPPIAAISRPGDYRLLRELVKAKGCLEKQTAFYIGKILLNLALLVVCITFLATVRHAGLQILNAVFLAFIYVQICMVVHDLGHHQVYRAGWKNDLVGALHLNLLLGISLHYWLEKHRAHHRHPNELDKDPDLGFPFADSMEQVRQAGRFHRFLIRYQAWLFLPWISLGFLSLHYVSIRFLLQRMRKEMRLEAILLAAHYVLYFGLLLLLLPAGVALLFVCVHQAACGVYLGLIFTINHMGMPILDRNAGGSFLYRQVVTGRDLRAHAVTDYLFGPLACQIEHHLFPTMPLNKLRVAQRVVKPFCATYSIPYHETSVIQAFREVLVHLHQVSKLAR